MRLSVGEAILNREDTKGGGLEDLREADNTTRGGSVEEEAAGEEEGCCWTRASIEADIVVVTWRCERRAKKAWIKV